MNASRLTEQDCEFVYIVKLIQDSNLCGGCQHEIQSRVIHEQASADEPLNLTLTPKSLSDLRAADRAAVEKIERAVELRALGDPAWWQTRRQWWVDRLREHNAAPYLWRTKLWFALAGHYTLADLHQGRDVVGDFIDWHASRLRSVSGLCQCPGVKWWRAEGSNRGIVDNFDVAIALTLWDYLDNDICEVLFRHRELLSPAAEDNPVRRSARLWSEPKVQQDMEPLKEKGRLGVESRIRELEGLVPTESAIQLPALLGRAASWVTRRFLSGE